MKPSEVLADNELIAAFMQSDSLPRRYDYDWNWLMPVVEKIEGLYYGDSIRIRIVGDRAVCYDTQNAQQANIYSGEGVGIISSARNMPSKIEAVYKAVVEFIKWYNSQK